MIFLFGLIAIILGACVSTTDPIPGVTMIIGSFVVVLVVSLVDILKGKQTWL